MTALTPSPAPLAPLAVRPWTPRPQLAPRVEHPDESMYRATSNGSDGCMGGWDLEYSVAPSDAHLEVRVDVRWDGVGDGFESTAVEAFWRDANGRTLDWSPLWEWAPAERGWIRVSGHVANVSDATTLVLRLSLRWSPSGTVSWRRPTLTPAAPPEPRRLRLAAASSRPDPAGPRTMEANTARVLEVCRQAGHAGVDLLCLPEVILSWGLPGAEGEALYRHAVEIPGPEIERFAAAARASHLAITFSVLERAGDLVHNTALLIDADGTIAARYRKVHLAPNETWAGITPGRDFPVAPIRRAHARVGLNICMDSSQVESSRIPARLGAEVLALPIMGDLRSDGWRRGAPQFDLDRWLLIQRMRALDNQLHLVAARNNGEGSGVFGPDGAVLALDRGDTPLVYADVDLAQRAQSWSGAAFADLCWSVRRERVYGPLSGENLPRLEGSE